MAALNGWRDDLSDLVNLSVWHAKHPANVASGGPSHNRSKRDDAGDVVIAVFFPDVIDYFATACVFKVHVDIWHRDT